MRDYDNKQFHEIMEQVNNEKFSAIEIVVQENEILELQYYLIRKSYYAVIVDDYPFEIVDKITLLEAMYYQVKLITMHNLNWDAFEEALGDVLQCFSHFDGICLLFKDKNTKTRIFNDFAVMTEIADDINKWAKRKRITILINK